MCFQCFQKKAALCLFSLLPSLFFREFCKLPDGRTWLSWNVWALLSPAVGRCMCLWVCARVLMLLCFPTSPPLLPLAVFPQAVTLRKQEVCAYRCVCVCVCVCVWTASSHVFIQTVSKAWASNEQERKSDKIWKWKREAVTERSIDEGKPTHSTSWWVLYR